MARPKKANCKVDEYAAAVLSGEIITGKFVKSACDRHVSDLLREGSKDFPYRFDRDLATSAINFFSELKLTKGKQFFGKPFVLELWQAFIIGSIFGWVEKATGHRRFRYAYNEIARKNGKSELAAGVGLKLAFFDGEPGAEVYAFATKRDQAKIVWDVARQMVRQEPLLKKRIRDFKLNMSSKTGANQKFEPMGADHSTLDGLNISGAIIDELHAHKDRRLVDVIETATGARQQPLVFEITTAGEYNPESICWQHREYCVRILDGIVQDDRWFAYIATIDEGDKWHDPLVWAKANPNLHVSKSISVIEAECKKAKEMPSDENKFRRYHLDEWTKQAERWISLNVWKECQKEYTLEDLRGQRCFAGLDLASTSDISALVLVFPDSGYKTLPFFWVPEENVMQRVRKHRVPYDVWIDQGHMNTTPGNVTDYAFIRHRHGELRGMFNIVGTAIDEWNATQLATELMSDGAEVFLWRQGMAHMAGGTKELERLIMQRQFGHNGNPVLTWMFDNVAIKRDAEGNQKIDRSNSREKVDGIVATVMAVALGIKQGANDGKSVYDERGVLWLGG